MCFGCNPYCGKCKPPMERPRLCSGCGRYVVDPEPTTCPFCGAGLPARNRPEVVFCDVSGQRCANPCGQRFKRVKAYVKCGNRTPPEDGDR